MHFHSLATPILAVAAIAAAAPAPPGPGRPGPPGPPAPPAPPRPPVRPWEPVTGLNTAIRALGKTWFGTAITIRDDPVEKAIYSNTADFGSVTPENAMKWESTEPTRGNFTFDGADAVVATARANGQQIHCHTLVWHSQLAPFVEAGNFDNATLIQVMTDHITAVAGRYKDVCTRWDVVNEGISFTIIKPKDLADEHQ
jgi:hypothetical protein